MAYVDLTQAALRQKALQGPKPFYVIAGGLAQGIGQGFKFGYEQRRKALDTQTTNELKQQEINAKNAEVGSSLIAKGLETGSFMPNSLAVPGQPAPEGSFTQGKVNYSISTPEYRAEFSKLKHPENIGNPFSKNPEVRGTEKFTEKVTADPQIKAFDTRLTAAMGVETLLKSNNPIADTAAQSQIARLSGEVGVLTDADVQRFGGSRDLKSKAQQYFELADTGKLTESNREDLQGVVDQFRKVLTAARADRAKTLAARYAKTYGIDQSKLEDIGGYNKQEASAPKPLPPPPPGATTRRRHDDGTVQYLDDSGNVIQSLDASGNVIQ